MVLLVNKVLLKYFTNCVIFSSAETMPAVCPVATLAQLAVRSVLDLVLERFLALAQGRTEDWSRVLYATLARYASPMLYAELFEEMLIRLDAIFAEQPGLRPRVRARI
jgi:hypothetical protein